NVHLAVFAKKFPVRVDNSGGVVINAGASFLEKRCDDDNAKLARELTKRDCRSTGYFFSQLEVFVIFVLAEILRPKKFRQANDLPASFGRIANEIDRVREIFFWLRAAFHLNQRDSRLAWFHRWIVRSARDVIRIIAKRSKIMICDSG